MNRYLKQAFGKIHNKPQVNSLLQWVAVALLPIYGKARKTHIIFNQSGQLSTTPDKKEKIIQIREVINTLSSPIHDELTNAF